MIRHLFSLEDNFKFASYLCTIEGSIGSRMIVVTGATGRYGSAIVRTLRKFDLPVRTLVRKGSHYYWLNDTGCGYFFGDLRDPLSLKRCLRDATHLVACTNIRRETNANNHKDVTIGGHEHLFSAAREAQIERTVLISCLGSDSDAPAFNARKAAEQALVESGIEHTILRACLHEHFFLELAWHIHDHGSVLLPANGNNVLPVLPTVDLAQMAAASLDLGSVRNQSIDVGGHQHLTFREALEMACEVVGVEPSIRTLPSPASALASRIGKPFRRFSNQIAEQKVWCSEDFQVDASALTDRFGFPLSDLRSAMVETNAFLADVRDPERREQRMVHPQFYATVYEPGTADLNLLPDGPPPRRD
jgi:uncharacterized protein YbjT (DUF2867 family)